MICVNQIDLEHGQKKYETMINFSIFCEHVQDLITKIQPIVVNLLLTVIINAIKTTNIAWCGKFHNDLILKMAEKFQFRWT